MGKILAAFLSVASAFVFTRAWQFWTAVQHIGNQRGLRYILDSNGFLSVIFPWRIRFISPGRAALLFRQYQDFKDHDCDLISSISVLPTVHTSFYLADPEAAKTLTSNRMLFPKPPDRYTPLLIYGPNLVSAEGEDWKRHKKVCAPSFSERNNRLVWTETIRIIEELFEDEWKGETVDIGNLQEVTSSISLFIICAASFGKSLSWKKADNECPPGYKMSFREVVRVMSDVGVALMMVTPEWLLKLGPTQTLREINTSLVELKGYMTDMIVERRAAGTKEECDDLFSNLLAANEDEKGAQKLSDEELIGNVWVMLTAGHQTTGIALYFAFIMLAIYQDDQVKFYEQIRDILPKGESPKYSDLNRYTRAQAILYETLRMYPAAIGVFKETTEDTVLTSHNCAGDPVNVALPKGSEIFINILAMHYHPRYWENPDIWNPDRFLKDWPREAFMPFSTGARACIGRRFAEVEAIAVLVMIISRYEVHFKHDPKYEHESPRQREERIMRAPIELSLKPKHIPLVFKKRY